jgi:cytoskeletal protein CcmA (bactofilin family)
MAVFKEPVRDAVEGSRRGSGPASLSIIANDLTVVGDLETSGVVKVEGRVQGAVRAATQVLVSKDALIEGDIQTKEAIIGGEVSGAIRAEDRVEIQATALINGDISARRIVMLEGGRVNGEIKMDPAQGMEGAHPEPGDLSPAT